MVIIPLTQGKTAIIDDEDAHIVKGYKWFAHKPKKTWYAEAVVRVGRIGKTLGVRRKHKIIKLHQLILGFPPKHRQIDHIDMDGLNNTRNNLRLCTQSENMRNQRIRSNNKSGFKGVTFRGDSKRLRRWKAEIMVHRKSIQLGSFSTAIEAAKAYNEASLKYHGEFGYRNLIP